MTYALDHPNQESQARQNQLHPSVPDDVANEFKERNQVKNDVELNTQKILKGRPFVFDEEEIAFADEDLDVLNVFTSGAEVVVDGVRQALVSRVFTSKTDRYIIIVKDTDGELVSATKKDKTTGKTTEVTLISKGGNVYATVTSDDLDDKKLEHFSMEPVMPPGETRRLRGLQVHNFVDASEHLTIDDDHRSLQGGRSSFDVIEVAIVVDSNLCAYAGSYDNASTLSQSVTVVATNFYDLHGLCKTI